MVDFGQFIQNIGEGFYDKCQTLKSLGSDLWNDPVGTASDLCKDVSGTVNKWTFNELGQNVILAAGAALAASMPILGPAVAHGSQVRQLDMLLRWQEARQEEDSNQANVPDTLAEGESLLVDVPANEVTLVPPLEYPTELTGPGEGATPAKLHAQAFSQLSGEIPGSADVFGLNAAWQHLIDSSDITTDTNRDWGGDSRYLSNT